jgi:hypothetical protein
MQHREVLNKCAEILNERSASYGNEDIMFDKTAKIATLLSNMVYTKYDISIVMEAIKLARRSLDPLHEDSYIDQINYACFSAQFASEQFAKPEG